MLRVLPYSMSNNSYGFMELPTTRIESQACVHDQACFYGEYPVFMKSTWAGFHGVCCALTLALGRITSSAHIVDFKD